MVFMSQPVNLVRGGNMAIIWLIRPQGRDTRVTLTTQSSRSMLWSSFLLASIKCALRHWHSHQTPDTISSHQHAINTIINVWVLYLVLHWDLIILHCDKIILKGSAPNINLAQNEKIVLHRFALTQYRNPVFVVGIF